MTDWPFPTELPKPMPAKPLVAKAQAEYEAQVAAEEAAAQDSEAAA